MGNVQQAVLEFDEEIQAPWRPRLVVVGAEPGSPAAGRTPAAHPSRRSPSRVGVCRPPQPANAPARQVPARRSEELRAVRSGSVPAARPSRGARPGAARRAPAPLRLTRRARRLAWVLAVAAGVVLGSWLAPLVSGQGGELRLAGESSVVVRSGDTLWSIASSLGGDGDVRALIDEIQELNGLTGGQLVPGQTLLLP